MATTTSLLDSQDEAVLSLSNPATNYTGNEGFKYRSANLSKDPKMREIDKYMRVHQLDVQEEFRKESSRSTLRRALRGEQKPVTPPAPDPLLEDLAATRTALRVDGCPRVNRHMTWLAQEKAEIPRMGNGPLPEEFQFPRSDEVKETKNTAAERQATMRHFDREHAEHQWRECMDHSLRRLVLDMELAKDERLRGAGDRVRCDHLDRVYDWYTTHGPKEVRKNKTAPPYVRFNVGGPVLPGSMRVAPKTRESATTALHVLHHARSSRAEPGLGVSNSLPSLTAVGGTFEHTMLPHKAGGF